jgi:hypothetical protein
MTPEDDSSIPFSAWYALNKDHLPPNLKKLMAENHEFYRFIAEDYMRGMKMMSKARMNSSGSSIWYFKRKPAGSYLNASTGWCKTYRITLRYLPTT